MTPTQMCKSRTTKVWRVSAPGWIKQRRLSIGGKPQSPLSSPTNWLLLSWCPLPGISASASNGCPGHWCCDGLLWQHGSDPTLQEWAPVAAAEIGSSPLFAAAPGSARSACAWPLASSHLEPLSTQRQETPCRVPSLPYPQSSQKLFF